MDAGADLYKAVCGAFVARHTTLTAWCRDHRLHRQNVARALRGQSNGPAAKALLLRAAWAAGVSLSQSAAQAKPKPKQEKPT